jgi:hypothetical protein
MAGPTPEMTELALDTTAYSLFDPLWDGVYCSQR